MNIQDCSTLHLCCAIHLYCHCSYIVVWRKLYARQHLREYSYVSLTRVKWHKNGKKFSNIDVFNIMFCGDIHKHITCFTYNILYNA